LLTITSSWPCNSFWFRSDFGIVLEGEIVWCVSLLRIRPADPVLDSVFDNGEEATFKAGSVCIQRCVDSLERFVAQSPLQGHHPCLGEPRWCYREHSDKLLTSSQSGKWVRMLFICQFVQV
jgi:hypothetical protein